VYEHNAEATRLALEAGARGLPHVDDVLGAGEPWNAFFRPSSS
jgi:formaldehyde-activating enzyme involved in methanogenesis